jgi:hypothetical protein
LRRIAIKTGGVAAAGNHSGSGFTGAGQSQAGPGRCLAKKDNPERKKDENSKNYKYISLYPAYEITVRIVLTPI